jgi:hypothetical protein
MERLRCVFRFRGSTAGRKLQSSKCAIAGKIPAVKKKDSGRRKRCPVFLCGILVNSGQFEFS